MWLQRGLANLFCREPVGLHAEIIKVKEFSLGHTLSLYFTSFIKRTCILWPIGLKDHVKIYMGNRDMYIWGTGETW